MSNTFSEQTNVLICTGIFEIIEKFDTIGPYRPLDDSETSDKEIGVEEELCNFLDGFQDVIEKYEISVDSMFESPGFDVYAVSVVWKSFSGDIGSCLNQKIVRM